MPTTGYVSKDDNGHFEGQLRTLGIRAEISILPNSRKANDVQTDYRVFSGDVEIGAGWNRRSQTSERDMFRSPSRLPSSGRAASMRISAVPLAEATTASRSSGTQPTSREWVPPRRRTIARRLI
jgi:uncharacterized protein (DUF736 family)